MLPAIFCAFLNKWLKLFAASSAWYTQTENMITEFVLFLQSRAHKHLIFFLTHESQNIMFLPFLYNTFVSTDIFYTCHRGCFQKKSLRCSLELWNFTNVPSECIKNSCTHFRPAVVLLDFTTKTTFYDTLVDLVYFGDECLASISSYILERRPKQIVQSLRGWEKLKTKDNGK